MEYENKDICKSCGGVCCKKSGCDYYTSDFASLSYKDILKTLEGGNISIVSTFMFKRLENNQLVMTPLLYLRARNINRDVVDLLSFKTTCSMLTDTGCSYDLDNRPSGGVNLIPKENKLCSPENDPALMMEEWLKYQKVLERCVKRISGCSVDQKLRMDAVCFFKDIIDENFDGISPIEIKDVKGLTPLLAEVYPNEFKNALSNSPCLVKRK